MGAWNTLSRRLSFKPPLQTSSPSCSHYRPYRHLATLQCCEAFIYFFSSVSLYYYIRLFRAGPVSYFFLYP